MDAVELEQRQNEDGESTIKKSKLVRGLKKRVRELEDKVMEYEQAQQPKGDNVPVINVGKTSEQKPPSEDQIVESEKYQQVIKEKEDLEKEKINLVGEGKKMRSELELLRKLVSQRNIDKEAEWDMINEKMKEISVDRDQLENERNHLKQQLIGMASVASDMHNVEELLRTNPDESAYVLQAESLKKANNVLQTELHDLIKKEQDLRKANDKLWMEKAQLQRVSHGPTAQMTVLIRGEDTPYTACTERICLKGVFFLSKMVYERMRVWTSGRSLPFKIFLLKKNCAAESVGIEMKRFGLCQSNLADQVDQPLSSKRFKVQSLCGASLILEALRSRFGHLTTNGKPRFAVSSFTLSFCPNSGIKIRG